jgi:hypothetical protein
VVAIDEIAIGEQLAWKCRGVIGATAKCHRLDVKRTKQLDDLVKILTAA